MHNKVKELETLTEKILEGEAYFTISEKNHRYDLNVYSKSKDKIDYEEEGYTYELVLEYTAYDYVEALNVAVKKILNIPTFDILNGKLKNKFKKINIELLKNYEIEILLQNQISNGYSLEVEKGKMPKITYTVYLYEKNSDRQEDYIQSYSVDTLEELYNKVYSWVK